MTEFRTERKPRQPNFALDAKFYRVTFDRMKLAVYMLERGLRLTEMSRRLGISPSRLHDYKTGRRIPRAALLARIEAETDGKVRAADFANGGTPE